MKGFRKAMTEDQLEKKEGQLKPISYPPNGDLLDMVKILSHDLRGSLVSVSATLKLLSRGYYGKMEDPVENSLRELLKRVTYLIGMSEECLEKSFSSDGSVAIKQEVLDLREDIIHPVLEELSSEIRDHRLRIDNRLESVPACRIPIKANKAWLKTIFRNLFKNAIRYGDAGGTIAFDFEIRGPSYRFNVYNSGNPIPEWFRDKLFTKVASVQTHNNHRTGGMGLGLYLIRKIIQKLGGKIWYEAKDHGSNFVLTLPIGAH
jgi:signal transduction histidine kinase